MPKKKNQKRDRKREVGRLNCKTERSKVEDYVTEEIFCLLLQQSEKQDKKLEF